jgi:Mg-chelatase subunit ChlD
MELEIEPVEVSLPIEEAELLILVFDGSRSMSWKKTTEDERSKVEHLMDIAEDLIVRLKESSQCDRYRVAPLYFATDVVPSDPVYTNPRNTEIENPVKVANYGKTAIAKALRKCREIYEDFLNDETLPNIKYCTVYLFTDGKDHVDGTSAVRDEASNLKRFLADRAQQPNLATIAFGDKADRKLLEEISSQLSKRQKRHLSNKRVLNYLPNKDRMFIEGHSEGMITEETAEALKQFVWVLSQTAKQ